MLYLIGFRRIDLNKDFYFNSEDPIYKYICDISILSEIPLFDINDLYPYFDKYTAFINTLNTIEEDYNEYNFNIRGNNIEDNIEYTTSDIFSELDLIPIKELINIINPRLISYMYQIINPVLSFNKDILPISYFTKYYDKSSEIKILSKHDDFIISFEKDMNKYKIYSESGKINKIVDWINYI